MMKSAISLLFFCILFFAPSFRNPVVSGDSSRCSGPGQEHQGLPVYHIYGPCSGLRSDKSFAEILDRDQLRVDSLNTRLTNINAGKSKSAPIPGNGRSLGAGNFVVNVGFGTPRRTFNLILDTGSDETWIKCKKCSKNCNELQNVIFNPSASSTFSNCSYDCDHNIAYLDQSYARGTWAFDTLTIPSYIPFPKFRFLCSDRNKGFGEVAGLLGLGRGDYSLVSQTSTDSDKVFCYHLPGDKTSSGFVLFGSEARQTCKFTNFTPLLSSYFEQTTKYFVNLVSISIGNKTVDVSYASGPGAMLDSGTVISRLPKTTYEQLRDTFKHVMMSYTIAPRPSGEHVLDTCYKLAGFQYDALKIPSVVMHFENVKVELDKSQILWKEDGKSSVYCLAFAGNKDENNWVIIGNQQQQKLNVMYDVQNNKVGIQAGN